MRFQFSHLPSTHPWPVYMLVQSLHAVSLRRRRSASGDRSHSALGAVSSLPETSLTSMVRLLPLLRIERGKAMPGPKDRGRRLRQERNGRQFTPAETLLRSGDFDEPNQPLLLYPAPWQKPAFLIEGIGGSPPFRALVDGLYHGCFAFLVDAEIQCVIERLDKLVLQPLTAA